jgi:hypothetical protein
MTHEGKSSFWVDLVDDQGRQLESLAIERGPVRVASALGTTSAGKYILEVEADGPWNIQTEQPRLTSAPQKISFSGENDAVTSLFELSSGLKKISMTHQGRKANS